MMPSSAVLLLARIKVKIHGVHFENWHDALVCFGIISLFVLGVKLLIAIVKAADHPVTDDGAGRVESSGQGKKIILLAVSLVAVFGFLKVMMRPPSTDATQEVVRVSPDKALVSAAERNDTKEVERILSSGVSPKFAWRLLLAPESRRCSSLVSRNVDVGIVRRFLDSGASIEVAMSDYDILWDLCSGPCVSPNCVEVARLFLERGAGLMKARRDSPVGGLLSVDLITGHHVAIVRLLLERGDDPARVHDVLKILSGRQKTSHDHGAEVLGLLIRHKKWPEKDLADALDSALQGYRFESCRQSALVLLQNGVPMPKDVAETIRKLNGILGETTGEGVAVTRDLILRLGGRVNPLKVPTPVRQEQTSPVEKSSHKGKVESKGVRQLHDDFARGTYRFSNGPSLLERALDDGADINAFDRQGNVPLVSLINSHWTGTNLEMLVSIMVEHGAKLNAVGNDGGETPLAAVLRRFNVGNGAKLTNVVAVLCRHGADPLVSGSARNCALETAFRIANVPGKDELIRQLLDATRPTSKIPARVLMLAAQSDFGSGGGAKRIAFVRELIRRGVPVTDTAVCAGWWDPAVRKALLEGAGKGESDFVAVECGAARVVRAVPKQSGDESSDRRRAVAECRHHEMMLEHESHFQNHGGFDGFGRMRRSQIESRLSMAKHRRESILNRLPEDKRSVAEGRFKMRATAESNRVARVFAQLDGMTNGAPVSASHEQERQDRQRAWAETESKLAARGVAAYRIRELRLGHEVETVRWERSAKDRDEWRERQARDKVADEFMEWLEARLREDERLVWAGRVMEKE